VHLTEKDATNKCFIRSQECSVISGVKISLCTIVAELPKHRLSLQLGLPFVTKQNSIRLALANSLARLNLS